MLDSCDLQQTEDMSSHFWGELCSDSQARDIGQRRQREKKKEEAVVPCRNDRPAGGLRQEEAGTARPPSPDRDDGQEMTSEGRSESGGGGMALHCRMGFSHLAVKHKRQSMCVCVCWTSENHFKHWAFINMNYNKIQCILFINNVDVHHVFYFYFYKLHIWFLSFCIKSQVCALSSVASTNPNQGPRWRSLTWTEMEAGSCRSLLSSLLEETMALRCKFNDVNKIK